MMTDAFYALRDTAHHGIATTFVCMVIYILTEPVARVATRSGWRTLSSAVSHARLQTRRVMCIRIVLLRRRVVSSRKLTFLQHITFHTLLLCGYHQTVLRVIIGQSLLLLCDRHRTIRGWSHLVLHRLLIYGVHVRNENILHITKELYVIHLRATIQRSYSGSCNVVVVMTHDRLTGRCIYT